MSGTNFLISTNLQFVVSLLNHERRITATQIYEAGNYFTG